MDNNVRNRINQLQLTILQDYFELQMKNRYGDAWLREVEQLVNHKINSNAPHTSTYRSLHDRIRLDGIETVTTKDMDITLITALLMYDFILDCEVGSNFRGQVSKIRNDKNQYISHNSDLDNKISNNIMELTSLKNLQQFVEYLRNATWECHGKEEYIDNYDKAVAEVIQLFYGSITEKELAAADLNSDINLSLDRILQEQSDHRGAYVALSYKRVDASLKRYTLEELRADNQRGFVVFADAGYGKSWSLIKLASSYAIEYLEDPENNPLPILIKMGQVLSDSSMPILEQIKEITFPSDTSEERVKQLIKSKKIILMIDGMDEAEADIKRNAEKELKNFCEKYSNIKIIGGTRESDRYRFPSDLPQYNICDLSDKQVEEFIERLVKEEYRERAKVELLSDQAGFLRNMRTPFYLTCYAEFVNYGETTPISSTDMVTRCLDRMIDREIRLKGFAASIELINTFLCEFCSLLGDQNYIQDNEAIRLLKEIIPIANSSEIDIVKIRNKLVEIQLLRVIESRKRYYLGFAQEQYRTIYAPLSNIDLFDFEEG